VIELSNEDRSRLEALSRKGTAEARMVERARIVLAAAAGTNNADIADDLGIALNTVVKWRKRFFEEGIAGLADRKRSGRPRRFPPLVVAEVKALACELPATTGVALSKWNCTDLAREVVERKVAGSISAATVWRVLRKDAIKPWLHRSWIFPRDPDFAAKAAVALDLYARSFEGQVLGDNEFVICADEKRASRPAAAATRRCHRAGPGRCGSSMSTTVAVPWPTWLPTMCTGCVLETGPSQRVRVPSG